MTTYDRIGHGYATLRQPDPRIAARIESALGGARSVVNVGAGTGSYEPAGLEVTAVEPSEVMIGQRPPGAAPVVQAVAEELPFGDDSFDAAMAVITVHHWPDRRAGIAEMARVARDRVLILTLEPEPLADLWLSRDYFTAAFAVHAEKMPPIDELTSLLPGAAAIPIPIPRRCTDGFFCALWDRPEMHLDPAVRACSSVWHDLPPEAYEDGLAALAADLESGAWDERYGHLREETPELDVGVRLVLAELG